MARRGSARPELVIELEHKLAVVESDIFARAIARCRKLGIYNLTIGNFSIDLREDDNYLNRPGNLVSSPYAPEVAPQSPLIDPNTNPASDDELLFWSVGGSEVKGARPDFSDSDFDPE